jgi:hypothetical protein
MYGLDWVRLGLARVLERYRSEPFTVRNLAPVISL